MHDHDEDDFSNNTSTANGGGLGPAQAQQLIAENRRTKLWLVCILLVAGSCMLAIIHLSNGLHSQLVGNRKMVRTLKEQLMAEGEEREAMLRDKDTSMGKTLTLRAKSKLVTEELLDQQRKSRRLSQELLLAREDLSIAAKNCTLSNLRMKNRFEVTLRTLHDRVVATEECRALLGRNVEERAKLESSLVLMQDRAYNASKLLKQSKQKLHEALKIASSQRDEIVRLKAELAKANSGGGSWFSSSSTTTATTEKPAAAEGEDTAKTVTVAVASPWKQYTDKTSGKKYWYNSVTKKSQWDEPKVEEEEEQTA